MKKISRKGFLKVAAAAAMSGVTASALAACNAGSSSSTAATGEAIYTPGTYTGTATGIGEVKVTMTFSETAITDVVIDASNETESKSRGGDEKDPVKAARFAAEQQRLYDIHGKADILDDPYYNPSLTRDREDFSESGDLRNLKEGKVTVRWRNA